MSQTHYLWVYAFQKNIGRFCPHRWYQIMVWLMDYGGCWLWVALRTVSGVSQKSLNFSMWENVVKFDITVYLSEFYEAVISRRGNRRSVKMHVSKKNTWTSNLKSAMPKSTQLLNIDIDIDIAIFCKYRIDIISKLKTWYRSSTNRDTLVLFRFLAVKSPQRE